MKELMWEYKIVRIAEFSPSSNNTINTLGSLGWELVSAVYDMHREDHFLYFKRDISR